MTVIRKPGDIHQIGNSHGDNITDEHPDKKGLSFSIQIYPPDSQENGFDQPGEKNRKNDKRCAERLRNAKSDGMQGPPGKAVVREQKQQPGCGTPAERQKLVERKDPVVGDPRR